MNYAEMVDKTSKILSTDTIAGSLTYSNGSNYQYINVDPSQFIWNGTATAGGAIGIDLGLEKKIKKQINSKPYMDSSEKFYRVIQDTPAWLKGALIYKSGECYVAHTELFNQEYTSPKYYESTAIVENATAYFSRVYRVKQDGKIKFLSKEEARKVVEEEIAKNA